MTKYRQGKTNQRWKPDDGKQMTTKKGWLETDDWKQTMEDRQGILNAGMKVMKDKRQTTRNGRLEIDDGREKTKGTWLKIGEGKETREGIQGKIDLEDIGRKIIKGRLWRKTIHYRRLRNRRLKSDRRVKIDDKRGETRKENRQEKIWLTIKNNERTVRELRIVRESRMT